MISEENIKMGNKALADDGVEQTQTQASGHRSSFNFNRLSEAVNMEKLSGQALALRDKVTENPKAAAGIALAVAGGIWAISRSVSASRRRNQLVSRLLVGAGLWRTLGPVVRAARKKGPKLAHEGMSAVSGLGSHLNGRNVRRVSKQLSPLATLLRSNAGPLLQKLIPLAVARFARRGRLSF